MANQRICSIPDCSKTHYGHGFCEMHYRRLRTHGDPLKTVRASIGEHQRFYREVVLQYAGGECLIWPYSRDTGGYGLMNVNGRLATVSRKLCDEVNGAPPTPEHEAAHSCGKGSEGCVTKAHLSWKTSKENKADMLTHGTHSRGERSHLARITEEQARKILSSKGKETQQETADRFGIARATVSCIQTGKRWSWL